jgi:hypothetical protein
MDHLRYGLVWPKIIFSDFCYLTRVVIIIDLVKNWEIGTIFTKIFLAIKCLYEHQALPSNSWLSKRTCLKTLNNCQITKFDMDLQKKQHEKSIWENRFLDRRVSQTVALKTQKRLFNALLSNKRVGGGGQD